MDTIPPPAETTAAKQRRMARGAELLAEAFAGVAAGRVVAEAEADAWIDSLGTGRELPRPNFGR